MSIVFTRMLTFIWHFKHTVNRKYPLFKKFNLQRLKYFTELHEILVYELFLLLNSSQTFIYREKIIMGTWMNNIKYLIRYYIHDPPLL